MFAAVPKIPLKVAEEDGSCSDQDGRSSNGAVVGAPFVGQCRPTRHVLKVCCVVDGEIEGTSTRVHLLYVLIMNWDFN